MKTTLIIPDVHLRIKLVSAIIKHEQCDKVIFLGDWFDQFGDSVEDNKYTADWLSEHVDNPDYTFLRGNHDISYEFNNKVTRCSGYDYFKWVHIRDVMEKRIRHGYANSDSGWSRFKWHTWLGDNWLLSHAGLHPSHVPGELLKEGNLKSLKGWLDVETHQATEYALKGRSHWVYAAGYARGGPYPFGGLVWNDFNSEFIPIKGINQLVGHTNQFYTRDMASKNINGSENHCIDYDNTFYAVWNGVEMIPKRIPENLEHLRWIYG